MARLNDMNNNPRTADIMEVMKRWEDVRASGWLTEERKQLLRDAEAEYTLLINGRGEYELARCEQVPVGGEIGKSGVRAFIFERNGASYAAIWDDKGCSSLEISAAAVKAYRRRVDSGELLVTATGDKASSTVEAKAYIVSGLSVSELKQALEGAIVTR
ncbi:MAG: hypothetical protein J6B71_07035, partial [Clostridia bacterium]|nr:hypothetical protein [Clostridia bacterium]